MMVDLKALSIWLQSWMCPREREKKMPHGFNHFCCHQYRVLGSYVYQDLYWKKKFKCKKQPQWTYSVHKLTWIVVMDDSNHQGLELGHQWLCKVINPVIMSWYGVEGDLHIWNGNLLFSCPITLHAFLTCEFWKWCFGFCLNSLQRPYPSALHWNNQSQDPQKKKGLQSGVWPLNEPRGPCMLKQSISLPFSLQFR